MDTKLSSTVDKRDYAVELKNVKHHVLMLFQSHDTEKLLYHNSAHTEQVVDVCTQMADYYHLANRDRFIVKTAAWFHDVGYFDTVKDHEMAGARRAEVFLKAEGIDAETIAAVKSCILATHLPQQPANLLEQILCDADLASLGMDGFFKRNKWLRREMIVLNNEAISKSKWYKNTLQLLQQHQYFTDYCRKQYNDGKAENLEALQHKLSKEDHHKGAEEEESRHDEKGKKEEEKGKKDIAEKTMEVVFRITATNNLRLSNMADSKAHIMITVNSIIISILVSVLIGKLDKYEYLTTPVILMLAVNLGTIIFSMLATKPRLPAGRFSQEEVADKKISLLFFGNYYRMNFDEYASTLTRVMEVKQDLHQNLIRDIYSQGVLLSKKYRMLKTAYNIFMYGLIISVIVFVWATLRQQ